MLFTRWDSCGAAPPTPTLTGRKAGSSASAMPFSANSSGRSSNSFLARSGSSRRLRRLVRFGVVQEGEGVAFDKPGEAEEHQQHDFQNHRQPAGAGGHAGHEKDHLQHQHTVAADAVYLVAQPLAGGHCVAVFGELEDAVQGYGQEEECGAHGVDPVGDFYRDLEESHGHSVGHPAHFAGEEHYAQARDACYRGYQVVYDVIADIRDEHQARGHQHSHQGGALVVCGGEAPPPIFAGMGCNACRKERQDGQNQPQKST